MRENSIKIVIVEDDSLIREGYKSLLSELGKFHCIAAYDSCENMLKHFFKDQPDIVLMDIGLPGISGIEGIKRIKKINPQTDIIAVTVHDDDRIVFDALCAGAGGYLTKNVTPEKLITSIEEIYYGGAPMSTGIAKMVVDSFRKNVESPLTRRETEVLQLISKGKSYTMIAGELFIDKETVKSHIKNIYMKLEVHSKHEAIEKATKNKLI